MWVHLGIAANDWEDLTQYECRQYVDLYGQARKQQDQRDAERALFQAQLFRAKRLPTVKQLRRANDPEYERQEYEDQKAHFDQVTKGKLVVTDDGPRRR